LRQIVLFAEHIAVLLYINNDESTIFTISGIDVTGKQGTLRRSLVPTLKAREVIVLAVDMAKIRVKNWSKGFNFQELAAFIHKKCLHKKHNNILYSCYLPPPIAASLVYACGTCT
jgi:hypothetical protein